MTIFGPAWGELRLEHVKAFLDQADDEPLLWEAKGTRLDKGEVRRQICGFANSHEGGYLIVGADRVSERSGRKWRLDGVTFPDDEPSRSVTDIVGDPERGVRPRPDFDVVSWPARNGHVAVVQVTPITTPPCITNGTVYERLPGRTQTVRDPIRLANLFALGDTSRTNAKARADRVARTVLEDELERGAGVFLGPSVVTPPEDDSVSVDPTSNIRFSVGVATTGNASNIAGRLFRHEFASEIWEHLSDRQPVGLPPGLLATVPGPVAWSQNALT